MIRLDDRLRVVPAWINELHGRFTREASGSHNVHYVNFFAGAPGADPAPPRGVWGPKLLWPRGGWAFNMAWLVVAAMASCAWALSAHWLAGDCERVQENPAKWVSLALGAGIVGFVAFLAFVVSDLRTSKTKRRSSRLFNFSFKARFSSCLRTFASLTGNNSR